MKKINESLDEFSVRGTVFEKSGNNNVRCFACGHGCTIRDGDSGICKVRFNRDGELYVPFGYVSGAQGDPVEKKPFFHVRPGALAYSFGMLGCNFHCDYCQNWITSQTLRDAHAECQVLITTPEELVENACSQGAQIMVSTYNEPLITSEWGAAVFKKSKAAGLLTGYVSNGYGTPEVLQFLRPWLDLCKVDLKTFDDHHYRQLGGRLQPVLDTIRSLYEMGIWVEIVTLLVPGFNDSSEELRKMTAFLSELSVDIPWHVTAFHKDYKMTNPKNTVPEDLLRAAQIGKESGLRFVYAGNLPGRLQNWENTRCPDCGELLIERYGFRIRNYCLTGDGRCPSCHLSIPGRWANPQSSVYAK
jgi:pyruvate formate lyase activating enzyme